MYVCIMYMYVCMNVYMHIYNIRLFVCMNSINVYINDKVYLFVDQNEPVNQNELTQHLLEMKEV